MAIRIIRLGTPRHPDEGLRIGTVRRPPRGVKKADLAARDFYDVWFPNLAPEAGTVRVALEASSASDWRRFEQQYRREMKRPDASRTLDVLAALSHQSNFALGCYCEQAERCHRSILEALLRERGADILHDC